MPAPAPKAELLLSLGRMTRGLSALFWGLPLALLLSVQVAAQGWLCALGPMATLSPVFAFSLLSYGLWLLGDFQRQERVWLAALERARLLALVNLGLAPFLHFYQRMPETEFFEQSVLILGVTSLLFLGSVNRVVRRLAAMLPDETLREESRVLTRLNLGLLLLVPGVAVLWELLPRWPALPATARFILLAAHPSRHVFLLLLGLLPLAITMALLWKIKEVILENVFSPPSPTPESPDGA